MSSDDSKVTGIRGDGKSLDQPKIANFKDPLPQLAFHTVKGEPIIVDMQLLTKAAERLGGINKGDVVSLGSHRNAKGQFVVDYDSLRIERQGE